MPDPVEPEKVVGGVEVLPPDPLPCPWETVVAVHGGRPVIVIEGFSRVAILPGGRIEVTL